MDTVTQSDVTSLMQKVVNLQQLVLSMEKRLTAAERLADGCKDAVCHLSEFVYEDAPKAGRSLFQMICWLVADAQRPPASAEGAEVVKGGGQ